MTQTYRGRFAPSPTGPLHFGSLVAALASWLDARANNGEWLVRIEDIDPPRVVAESEQQILYSLEAHGLSWDGPISYQSQRHEFYKEALNQLQVGSKTYSCICTRADVADMGGAYDGRCKAASVSVDNPHSIRFAIEESVRWQDFIQGPTEFDKARVQGDFVLFRRDEIFSYQLAVAVDDWQQEITHVIRGFDLFDSTARQLMLLKALDREPALYGHFPVAMGSDGQKLSKQNQAEPLDDKKAVHNLIAALKFLGQKIPQDFENSDPAKMLDFATAQWNIDKVPETQSIRVC
jgi:glutamyl-Q tRNA(Asp) synthetase